MTFLKILNPMIQQPNSESVVINENNVRICENFTIGKCSILLHHLITATNSYVNKLVPKFSIVVGVSAKFIKSR